MIEFQSTHPVWGATPSAGVVSFRFLFQSTHPVWGATALSVTFCCSSVNFNPRTPCGVRHDRKPKTLSELEFQSTHPVWGATRSAASASQ